MSNVSRNAGAAPIAIALHGGAGIIDRSRMTAELDSAYRAALATALDAGHALLERCASALDAVTETVRILENDPLFNAGHGAVLTHDGVAELDASIMDGAGPRAGAVAGIRHVRNPIELARRVMEQSPHVMLVGSGAEEFALEQKLAIVPNSYFRTKRREEELQRALQRERAGLETVVHDLHGGATTGTVGAVALDRNGNLAAATSTGGMTNKRYGRVGDSPIIGAGTYADNETCAVSATGSGEYFIRSVVAHEIHALMKYRGYDPIAAARELVHGTLERLGGDGGVIVVDRKGRVAMEFNTEGMFRAAHDAAGCREIAIYREPA